MNYSRHPDARAKGARRHPDAGRKRGGGPAFPTSRKGELLLAIALAPIVIATILASDRAVHAKVPSRTKTVWDSVYSAAQAARGESSYVATCARCHKAALSGGDEAPPLTGSGFLSNWNAQSVRDLHDRIRSSMPTDDPGTYKPDLVSDVIAYMFKVNGFPAGATELSPVADSLKDITIQSTKP